MLLMLTVDLEALISGRCRYTYFEDAWLRVGLLDLSTNPSEENLIAEHPSAVRALKEDLRASMGENFAAR